MPTPATSEPGFTVQPVNKNGEPTNNPNERWYDPNTGRLLQKGITQVLRENQLLRTPSVTDSTGGLSAKTRREHVRETVVNDLLPTTTARDYKDGTAEVMRDGAIATDTLARQVINGGQIDLIPTPQVDDGKNSGHNQQRRETLASTVYGATNWGKFEPAIRRWENILGRPAPAPTKPDGKDGAHRLSSKFTEFLMGVPDGWITDVGLTRNQELKACGNGVVPQQAELALRILLEGIELPARGGQVNLPTPTVSDTFTGNLKSSQQKPGSLHSVTLPTAVMRIVENEGENEALS